MGLYIQSSLKGNRNTELLETSRSNYTLVNMVNELNGLKQAEGTSTVTWTTDYWLTPGPVSSKQQQTSAHLRTCSAKLLCQVMRTNNRGSDPY